MVVLRKSGAAGSDFGDREFQGERVVMTSLRRALGLCMLAGVLLCGAGAYAASPPPSVYGNLPGVEKVAISPSGDHVAIIGVIDDIRRLIVLDKDAHAILTVPIGALKLRNIRWAGEESVLIDYSQTQKLGPAFVADKAEFSSMLVVPIQGGKPWAVFDKNPIITGGTRGFYGVLERAGHWYGYFGGITLVDSGRGNDPELLSTNPDFYEVDMQTGKAQRIARHGSEAGYRRWLVGPEGKVAATLDFDSTSQRWWLNNSDRKTIASGRSALGGIGLVSLGRTPDTIVYSVDDDTTGEGHWFEIPSAGGPSTEILQDVEVGRYHIDARSRQLIGYVKDADVPEDHFYDRVQEKTMAGARRAFPGLTVSLIDASADFTHLIVMTEGVGDPQTWWRIDVKTGSAKPLGVSYPGALDNVGPMRMVSYKAADGLEMAGVLTLPPGRKPAGLPIVVFPHGGPTARDYPVFDWWAQAFAVQGYAVFQPNFRGSTGSGAEFEKAGNGEWGRKMQTDISDGVAELVRQGLVDPKRACIMGASYGGYAALAGVTLQHGLYRCAVAVAGVSDLEKMYNTDVRESDSDPTLIRNLKAEIGSGRALRDVSPIRFVDRADAPILLIHGKDDTVVNYEQSEAMARALKQAGKPVEFVTLAGEDHWLSKSATRLAMLQAALDFIEHHNPPDHAP